MRKRKRMVLGYILDANRQPRPCYRLEEFMEFFGDPEKRRVALNKVGRYEVSTVFLCLSGAMPRRLFETALIIDDEYEHFHRYDTWDEAQAGHDALVLRLRTFTKQFKRKTCAK